MNKLLALIFLCSQFLMISCEKKTESEQDFSTVEDLFEADRNFSKLSAETSVQEAFLIYADSGAIMLRENRMPVIGKSEISNLFVNFPDNAVLTWEPLDG